MDAPGSNSSRRRRSRKQAPAGGPGGAPEAGLKDIILIVRSSLKQVMEFSHEVNSREQAISLLDALGRNATRLARLLEAEKRLSGGQSELEQALTEAMHEIQLELEAEAAARTAAIEQAWKDSHDEHD